MVLRIQKLTFDYVRRGNLRMTYTAFQWRWLVADVFCAGDYIVWSVDQASAESYTHESNELPNGKILDQSSEITLL